MKKLLLVAVLGIVGCRQEKPPVDLHPIEHLVKSFQPKPDPFSASELVKTHPRLRKICDIAGGCNKVNIECRIYDDSGNSILRNETCWEIETKVATGYGFFPNSNTSPAINHKAIEAAIDNWFDHKRLRDESHKDEPIVYPNHHSCDEHCLETK